MIDTLATRGRLFQTAAGWGRSGAQLWLSGLRQAVPKKFRDWAKGELQHTVLVWRKDDIVICRLASTVDPIETCFAFEQFGAATFAGWLGDNGLAREKIIVQALIPANVFFLRELKIPKSALQALPNILEQELLRRTPFHPNDVWHAGQASGDAQGDVATISHWIVRRDRAAQALAKLGLSVDHVDCLSADRAFDQAAPPALISFAAKSDQDPDWAIRGVRSLALAAGIMTLLAVGLFEWSQACVAASIEAALDDARETAQTSRDTINPAARLFALKGEVGVLEALDELSRILPDYTFLTDLRIADGKVTMSGFSADAARLVRVIDESRMFSGAALTSAITPDAAERKERFAISAKLRGGTRQLKLPASPRRAS